jgi:hypothetical protein
MVLSRYYTLDIVDYKSLVRGAEEQDAIGGLMQSCDCRMVVFIGLHRFHKTLSALAFLYSSHLNLQPLAHRMRLT